MTAVPCIGTNAEPAEDADQVSAVSATSALNGWLQ